jgi:acyl-CoA reductase-like NAD-dependent aldehyde dehydrogenase
MYTSKAEIIASIKAAHAAKNAWKILSAAQRVEILRPLLHLIKKHQEEIAQLITIDIGKPITQSHSEVEWTLAYLHDFLDNGPKYLAAKTTVKEANTLHQIIYEPYGVAASIAPWNFPFSNFIISVIPLLIAGNTVVFKHSEECMKTGKFADELMQQLNLLKGVYAQIYGGSDVGQILVAQDIDLINFTGSSQTGKALYALAGQKCIKAILEMGGSDPAVILQDAALEDVIPQLISRRFDNCGQVCCAVKRLIVHESIYDAVLEKLVQQLSKIKIGDPMDAQTQIGPLVSEKQLALLASQVQDSLKEGAVAAIGGAKPEGLSGHYYLPTVLTHIKRNMRVWTEEVFGPVLPIISFSSENEAITLANDTPYGLSAVVYTQDIAKGRFIAEHINAGCVDINLASHWRPCNPFGGYKASGIGRIYGEEGFRDLCQIKVIAE